MHGCAQIHANYVQAFTRMQTQFGNGNAQAGGGNIYSGANRLIIPDYRGDNSKRPTTPGTPPQNLLRLSQNAHHHGWQERSSWTLVSSIAAAVARHKHLCAGPCEACSRRADHSAVPLCMQPLCISRAA